MPIPNPESGQTRDEFISKCMKAIADEYGSTQGYAICRLKWADKANLAAESVSIDYDGSLSTAKGKELLKRLQNEGKNVYIVTARSKSDMETVYSVGEKLGVNKDHIFSTDGKSKIPTLERLKIKVHYDNNPNVVDEINKTTDIRAILI